MAFGGMGDVAGPGGGGANVSAGGIGFGGDIGHGDVGHGSGQVDPGLAAAAGGPGAGSGLGQSVGSASAGGTGGEAEAERSIAAFRSAIAKALGISEIAGFEAPAQPGSQALEAHDMDTDAVRNALEAAGMFDDPSNVDPADDFDAELAYGTGATVAQDTHDADLALHTGATSLGTLGPHYGYDAVEEQVYGGKKSALEKDVNKSVNIGIESEYDSHMNSLVSAVELEYENIMENTAPFSKERNKALRELNAIKDTALYSKAYNVSNPSAVRNMIAKAMGFFGMGTAFSLAQALENKAIERGLFDRTTFDQMMKEFDDPAAFGAAGNPLGTGGSDENKQRKIIMELFYQTNPWARGLNQRQIDYYLDRPSELEWVQNLYNQMNPS